MTEPIGMTDRHAEATPGEVAYLAWWREFEHGHGYDREAYLNLPQRHRNAWDAAARAAKADPRQPHGAE